MTADKAPDLASNPGSPAIRAAASLILARPTDVGGWQILMGQRGAAAVFMPSKYVFPGGRVEAFDAAPNPLPLADRCCQRLGGPLKAGQILGAGLRELREETGLSFSAQGLQNHPPLYMFRAITPLGRPRRFDAHFFLADARGLTGDLDDFSSAEDELSHLHWIGLAEARALDLPFVTEVVLAEASNLLQGGSQPGVPFFDNAGPVPQFRRLD